MRRIDADNGGLWLMVNGLPPFGVNVGFGSAIKTSFHCSHSRTTFKVNGLPPFGVNVGFGSAMKTSFHCAHSRTTFSVIDGGVQIRHNLNNKKDVMPPRFGTEFGHLPTSVPISASVRKYSSKLVFRSLSLDIWPSGVPFNNKSASNRGPGTEIQNR